jgi:hypothetical protein
MRKLLLLTSLAAFTLAGCTTAQIQTATTEVESAIQQGTAALCGIIPELQTITTVAGVLFPGVTAITAIAGAGEAAVEAEICTAAPPPASARYRSLPRTGSYPGTIGTTTGTKTVVTGWRAR